MSQAEARRAVRAQTPAFEGLPDGERLPYDQSTKVARFAAWVVLFQSVFQDPYAQLSDQLAGKPADDFYQLERSVHNSLNQITGVTSPNREDMNQFDLWAGGLTAAVHTVSTVRSAEPTRQHFEINAGLPEVASRMLPVLTSLIMEHQDRLGDIKIGLSEILEGNRPAWGSYAIDPNLLEVTSNGKIRFQASAIDGLPILEGRKVGPRRADAPYFPSSDENTVGQIKPRGEHIGCPISFMNGFGEALLRVTTESAEQNELL